MQKKIHDYPGKKVVVTYDSKRCIHAAECVRGLPGVFDPDRTPWIQPDNADSDAVSEVISRCPTGALQIDRRDDGGSEPALGPNTVHVIKDGPLYVRGTIELVNPDGSVLSKETRVALCRCGLSSNKPLCDNSHRNGFEDPGSLGTGGFGSSEANLHDDELRITLARNGPLLCAGPVEIVDADGTNRRSGGKTALCRCGASRNKPFCDGSHREIGFSTDPV
ncbi:MAG: CDGSH iron-sulfur domain-containing protein [Bacteroidetes bacterium]|nr:CDGSH iron-sulfur domain-containing protein [Bacteroidota bacterium]